MSPAWQVGIDIGGTFTDVVALPTTGGTPAQAKVRSHPEHPIASLLDALDALGIAWEDVDDLVHGTTMITNAIVEDRLAPVALVTTEGFEDSIAIGRQNRLHLYRLDLAPKPPEQVPEERRFGVHERLDADGTVEIALDDAAVEAAVRRVAACGARAVAVSLLHAYANGDHETRLGTRFGEVVPHVALSHRVSPESREYERTTTTVLSAGVMPLAAGYLDALEEHRPEPSRLHLFHSAGGMAAPADLRAHPLGLALSGPAAGVAAAGAVAAELGLEHAISFDMGGTTTDVCLVVDGRAEIRSDRSIAGRPLRMPMVAVESIGAGGGSIARLDTGALRVGPHSAGAEPGPACYARGGTDATVTDANLALGYLDAERAYGGIALDRAAAERALAPLAAATGTPPPALALGIVRVANAAMARALRRVTVERGVDGRRCVLVAFGGAGPMHAVELARSFGIGKVVIPRLSSVFSALGCVSAEMRYTRQQTVRMASERWNAARIGEVRAALRATLAPALAAAGHRAPVVVETAAVRYRGQSYAVEVEQPALEDPERLGAQFRERHEALYGFATAEAWELVALRVELSGPRAIRPAPEAGSEAGAGARSAPCLFDASGPIPTSRHERAVLAPGRRLEGPAIVEDEWSTVVLPPGATLTVDAAGHLHVDVGAPA